MDELTALREYAEDTRDNWPDHECQIDPYQLIGLLDIVDHAKLIAEHYRGMGSAFEANRPWTGPNATETDRELRQAFKRLGVQLEER